MRECTMCTSIVLAAEALPEQPEITIGLFAVPGSGMVTLFGFVPLQVVPVTVSVYGVLCVFDGEVPVTLTTEVPGGVLVKVLMVMVDEPPAVTDGGLNDALAPAGRPLAENVTVSAEPEVTAVLTVALTEPPGAVEPEVGLPLMEKSLPVGHGASLPATLTAVQAAWTVRYSVEQNPYRSL